MKRAFLATAACAALGLGVLALRRRNGAGSAVSAGRSAARLAPLLRSDDSALRALARAGTSAPAEDVARRLLLYAVPPLWIGAGTVDWICHRAAHIESTAGRKESLIHLLMQIELGLPVLACLFLEVTPPVLALSILSFILHQATAYWDLSYASPRREITPLEQQAHSFLELVPLIAITLLVTLRWEELLALFGANDKPVRSSISLRRHPLPARYVGALLGATALFGTLPYLEELWRTWRWSRR